MLNPYRRDGRAVECTGLENRRGCKSSVGSNPTSSATALLLKNERATLKRIGGVAERLNAPVLKTGIGL